MENTEDKKQERFYSKIFNKPFFQTLLSKKITRLLFLLSLTIVTTLVFYMDTDSMPSFISNLLDVIMMLIFSLLTLWRLNDIERPRWLVLGTFILFGMLYIDYEILTNVIVVILIGIVVLLSYLPSNSAKKPEIEEIKNNIVIKNKIFNKKVVISFILGLVIMFGAGWAYFFYIKNNNCLFDNVGIVEIFGEIDLLEDPDYTSTSSLNVVQQIEELDANPDIKGIVLNIASGGGYIQPSEEIMLAVQRVSKPIVAVIRDVGASGAYMIASAADRVYANRMSDIGSIGITLDFLDTSEKDRREGIIFYDFSSAKYKGAFKEHSKMTQEQRDNVMKGIMESHDIFVEYIARNRNIPLEKVKLLATGESWGGDNALKMGLIDQIGGMPEARAWMNQQIGEDVSYCNLGE